MRKEIEMQQFWGGLNTKTDPLHAPIDESPDCRNVEFDDIGSLTGKRGVKKYAWVSGATAPIDMLKTYNDGKRDWMVAVCNDALYQGRGGGAMDVIPGSTGVFSSGVQAYGTVFQDNLFVSNGESAYKWDGVKFSKWGMDPVPVSAVASCYTGVNGPYITGSYQYALAPVNSAGAIGSYTIISDPKSFESPVAIDNIYQWPSSAGVQYKQLCRNTAAATSTFWVVTQIANDCTYHVDFVPDNDLVTLAPMDRKAPVPFTAHTTFLGRMFGANRNGDYPSVLYYSTVNEPETFPGSNMIRVGEGDGYKIFGIATLANAVMIAKNDGEGNGAMYLLYMPDNTPENWSLTKLDTDFGAQSHKGFAHYGNNLMYVCRYGAFRIMEGATGDVQTEMISFPIEKDFLKFSRTYMDHSASINYKNKVWISVPDGHSSETNNKIYQFDYTAGDVEVRKGAWTRFADYADGSTHYYNVTEFAIYKGLLMGGCASESTVYQLDTDRVTPDSGDYQISDILYKTVPISGTPAEAENVKIWRYLWVTYEATVAPFAVSVYYALDYSKSYTLLQEIDLTEDTIPLFDTAKWGQSFYKGDNIVRKRILFQAGVASRTIQLKIESVGVSASHKDGINKFMEFKLYNMKLDYNSRGDTRVK